MEEELRSGIETLKDIAEGAVPPEISIEEAKAILKRYKELEERDEARTYTVNKVITEYIPDYELISLVNRYKNESFIPRVEVEKVLEERNK